MTRYIALLRGVNVGGITIRSADLRALFDELGFDEVRTVLASGNVVFTATDDAASADPKQRIEQALRDRFGYDAWIVLVTRKQVERVIEAFPFDASDAARQPWVVFGSDDAVLDDLVASAGEPDPQVDPIARGEGVVYWNPVKGTTVQTPFAKLLAKPRYKPTTTNRNLRTLQKLLV
ncbi:DUF1697 domain-containing protein [Agromyces ramosus]|uniref:Uncharacterized protein (DUF1697 family) n=1 Tax=Agromyces ramosus TaxID=33879 RepID=A0ABU0R628_9MICO|nr:DUF1697 domain-containing protein [Agromyces ramosus]MDQ0892509.1 uncharacterized protein (DUF1697 family) [Agromyces ramosus]